MPPTRARPLDGNTNALSISLRALSRLTGGPATLDAERPFYKVVIGNVNLSTGEDSITVSTAPPMAVLLPGIVRYAPLVGALGPEIRAVPKELEVYAHDALPDDHSVASEMAGLERFLDE